MSLALVRTKPAIINIICLLLATATVAVMNLVHLQPLHQGFFCDDESLRYPYKKETISTGLLLVICFLPPALVVAFAEVIRGIRVEQRRGDKEGLSDSEDRHDGLKRGGTRALLLVGCLFYGNCLNFIVSEIMKLSFGQLRPHFLAACQPATDITKLANCTGLYLEHVTCRNSDKAVLTDIRKSFVSGHASFSVFNMMFLVLYLQFRMSSLPLRFLLALLQSVAVGLAIFICGTRIYDHYHHPWDVFSGAVIGMVFCWFTVFKVCPNFIRHQPISETLILPMTDKSPQLPTISSISFQTKE